MGNQSSMMEPIKFLNLFNYSSNNGLYFNSIYLPEEIVTTVLSFVDPDELLKCSQVCKKWFDIVRSHYVWYEKYERHYARRPKNVPWYVYYALFRHGLFDNNLLLNGNGEERFAHWELIRNYGDSWIVEKFPVGSDPLPSNVEEFNGHTSCFATSYYECDKSQEISFSPLSKYILKHFKPHIYVSEWVAGRTDCGCLYILSCKLYDHNYKKSHCIDDDIVALKVAQKTWKVEQWRGGNWTKIDVLITDYSDDVETIVFQHMGQDTQFWKGHYGAKMAGGVVKLLFDSLKELT